MNNEELEQEYSYLIPKNVKIRFTFFPGFGWFELFMVAIGGAVGIILFSLVGIFTKSLIRIFLVFIPLVSSFVLTQADNKTGMSVYALLKDFKEYKMSQRRYLYKCGSGRVNV